MQSPRARLRALLVKTFSEDDRTFELFVSDYFEDFLSNINWKDQVVVQAEAFIRMAVARACIDKVWPALLQERAGYAEEIRDIQEAWEAAASGNVVASAPAGPAISAAPLVAPEILEEIYRAARSAQLESIRPALYVGLEQLHTAPVLQNHAQLWIDVNQVGRAGGDPLPLVQWLNNARVLTGSDEFADLLDRMGATAEPEAVAAEELSEEETGALEAIVMASARPAIAVRQGTFAAAPEPWRATLEPRRALIDAAIAATGRLDCPDNPHMPWAGTGVVFGRNLVAAARHVADVLFHEDGSSRIGRVLFDPWREEDVPVAVTALEVTKLVLRHPAWDFALMAVPGLSALGVAPMVLATEPPPEDADIVRVTFVALDSRADVGLQKQLFGARLNGAKWILPGKATRVPPLRDEPLTQSAAKEDLLEYDSSTLAGTGGPVVSVDTGHLLGFGVMRQYLLGNWAVPAWEIARDPLVRQAIAAASPP